MARRSSGGRSARPAPRPAARPTANSPPLQQAPRAPPPAPARGGSGGSFFGAMADGLGFGAGNAVAHRAVDAVMGPRTIQHEAAASEAPAHAAANKGGSDACTRHSKAFQDCLNGFGSEISKCQFYMDMLAECRRTSGSVMSS